MKQKTAKICIHAFHHYQNFSVHNLLLHNEKLKRESCYYLNYKGVWLHK